ncbi:four-carbon acid sugar kinase family protein [Agrobacterium sp. T29]|uniref:four-carbon acid sugar kinase family protein n=1 Tax=Agrobacterium sp. T29 TaxID=2580515 RepID=UPI001FED9805|nr:four-carbon acid sugar kinase family protein [Agrobacterium sp. T29]
MVACYLESAGINCPVMFGPHAAVPPAAIVVAGTRTRTVPVIEAISELQNMAGALERAGCRQLAYKACATFDSTADGNIGPAADFLSDRAGGLPVVMSAGFPSLGTTVHQGYLFYRGRLVSESIKRFDPLTPMEDPDLARFIGRQTPHRVALINHTTLQKGADAVCAAMEALQAEGARHVLMDASDDGDVDITAQAASRLSCVVAASDPLVIAYAKKLAMGGDFGFRSPPRHADGPAAVLIGSVGPVALEQLAAFGAIHPVLTLDVLDPRNDEALVGDALDWAASRIGTAPFAVSTAANPDEVERVQSALGPLGAARRAETLLGTIAKGLCDRGIRRFVVAGGETSGAVVRALGIDLVRALPEGPMGTGFCVVEEPVPLSLYLKPGKLGAPDILLRALAAMDSKP